jgi:hypothetical protein
MSAKSRLLFLKKNFKSYPLGPYKKFLKTFREIFYNNILLQQKLFYFFEYFIAYKIYFMISTNIYFPYGPQGGGACRFLYRDNNMMQVICKLLFVWRRKLV